MGGPARARCGRAINRVDSCGENANLLIAIFHGEIDIRTFAAADPVALPFQNLFGPVGLDFSDIVYELLCIFRDAETTAPDLAFPPWYRSASICRRRTARWTAPSSLSGTN